MLILGDQETKKTVESLASSYESVSNGSFIFDSFLDKLLNRYSGLSRRSYPYTVKLPKSIRELQMGDFTPSREIVISEPILNDKGHPMWYGDSTDGIKLRVGYRDNDSTQICEQALDDKVIHGVAAGKTGMGKSNTVNVILAALMEEYPPWELQLYLLDAKIAEFKPFATTQYTHHVKSVAATEDGDYMLSLLEDVLAEMNTMNSIYTLANAKKLDEFRKNTGLVIPQTLIVFDEFQAAMKHEKQAKKMLDILDLIARKGRNTGYHLLLCSQGLDANISADMLAQFTCRIGLPIERQLSTKLLGNEGAGKIFEKGDLLMNTRPTDIEAGEKNNQYYKVPFIPTPMLIACTKECKAKGEYFGLPNQVSFYDEDAVIKETDFRDTILKIPERKDNKFPEDLRFYLGMPSFIYKDPTGIFNIRFTHRDYESLLISAGTNIDIERHSKCVKFNLERLKKLYPKSISINMAYADMMFVEEVGFNEIIDPRLCFKIDSTKDVSYKALLKGIYQRLLMISTDENAFSIMRTDGKSDKIFEAVKNKYKIKDSKIARVRTYYITKELQNVDKYKLIGINTISDTNEDLLNLIGTLLKTYVLMGCEDCKLTLDKLTTQFMIIAGLNNILGLGVDNKSSEVTTLKNAMIMSKNVKVKLILITKTMDDMRELTKLAGFTIVDQLEHNERTRAGLTDPPTDLRPGIVLFQSLQDKKIMKFKRFTLLSELPQTEKSDDESL